MNTLYPLRRALRLFVILLSSLFVFPTQAQDGLWYGQTFEGTVRERYDNALVAVGDRLYLMGGYGPYRVDAYDPINKRWERLDATLPNLHHFQAQVYRGEVYIAGALGGRFTTEYAERNIYIYDPDTDVLRKGPLIPANRRRGAAATVFVDNTLYLIGGNEKELRKPVAWVDAYNFVTGEWTVLPDLPRARDNFQAQVYQGRIYCAGGGRMNRTGNGGLWDDLEATVDVYDIATGRWLDSGERPDDLPEPRTTAATAIADGQLIVAGGQRGGGEASRQVHALDLTTGKWRRITDALWPRRGSQLARLGNRFYTAAGAYRGRDVTIAREEQPFVEFFSFAPQYVQPFEDWITIGYANYERAEGHIVTYDKHYYWFNGFQTIGDRLTYQDKNEKYAFAHNRWSDIASSPLLPDGRTAGFHHTGVALVEDTVWIAGGRAGYPRWPVSDTVWLYSIKDDTWTIGPRMPRRRGGGGLVRLGRKLHYVGGFDGDAHCDSENHFVYDLDNRAAGWKDITKSAGMPLARNHFGAVVYAGKLYAVGGQHGHDGCQKGQNLPYLHVYDPIDNSWTRLADLPHSQSHNEPGVFTYNNKIYSVGGQHYEGDEVWEYDPAADTWTTRDDLKLPLRLIASGARVYDDHLIVMTGGDGSVNFPRREVRKTYFGPNTAQNLGFHPNTLTAAADRRSTTDVILYNTSAEDEVAFTIPTDDLPPWLSLNRTSGLARESHQEVSVTVDPAGLSAGTYSYTLRAEAVGYTAEELTVSFTVDGDNPPPPPPPPPPPSDNNLPLYLEAECAAVGSSWLTETSAAASEGSYVAPRPGKSSTGSPPADETANHVTFVVDVPQQGAHRLYARLSAPNSQDDSFWVRINGGDWVRWWRDLRTGQGEFAWREFTKNGALDLPAGTLRIDFAYREDGTLLDKLYLTRDGGPAPSGMGAAASNCGQDDNDPPTDPPAAYWAEAECATVGADWAPQSASGATAGGYLLATQGAQYKAPPTTEAVGPDRLSYTFEVSAAGTYAIWLRLDAPDNASNSLWVSLDGGPWMKFWRDATGSNLLTDGFEWHRVSDDRTAKSWTLEPGSHTVVIARRESNTAVDMLALTSLEYTPQGQGEAATNCGQDDDRQDDDNDDDPPTDPLTAYWAEAECATVGDDWAPQSTTAAAAGGYVLATQGAQHKAPPTTEAVGPDRLSYTFEVSAAGTYAIWLRLDAPDNASNSLWISLDGGPWMKFWRDAGGFNLLTDGFEWHRVSDDRTAKSWNLEPGSHTVVIAKRETNTAVDKLALTPLDYTPQGEGEAATNCGISTAPGNMQSLTAPTTPETVAPRTVSPTMELYPNPTRSDLQLMLEDVPQGNAQLLIHDARGRLLGRRTLSLQDEQFRAHLPLTGLGAGTYLLTVVYDGGHLSRPFIRLP